MNARPDGTLVVDTLGPPSHLARRPCGHAPRGRALGRALNRALNRAR